MSIEIGSLVRVVDNSGSTLGYGVIRDVINDPMCIVSMEEGGLRQSKQALCFELNTEEQIEFWKKRYEDLRDYRDS